MERHDEEVPDRDIDNDEAGEAEDALVPKEEGDAVAVADLMAQLVLVAAAAVDYLNYYCCCYYYYYYLEAGTRSTWSLAQLLRHYLVWYCLSNNVFGCGLWTWFLLWIHTSLYCLKHLLIVNNKHRECSCRS